MKKIILIVLIAVVLLATPCLAQEIEPRGLFSIENTVWSSFPPDGNFLGFVGERVYSCKVAIPIVKDYLGQNYICSENSYGAYIDSLPVSTFGIDYGRIFIGGELHTFLGIGILHEYIEGYDDDYSRDRLLLKIDNNWTPHTDPIVCGGIAGIQCPKNMSCVDDPRDDCLFGVNPDCSGFCVYDFPTPSGLE